MKVFFANLSIFLFLFFNTSFVYSLDLNGRVIFEGNVPKFKNKRVDHDSHCVSQNKTGVPNEILIVDPDKGLLNVLVVVKGLDKKLNKQVFDSEVVLNQEGCMYSPHVLALQIGQTLKILNPDPTFHNVHCHSKLNDSFNIAMPAGKKTIKTSFKKQELFMRFGCDVHPWMKAWVSVISHPFFDITKKGGHFEIKNLPKGKYTLLFKHERLGEIVKEVNLPLASPLKIPFRRKK